MNHKDLLIDLGDLLKRGPVRRPTGTKVAARRWGRSFVMLDLDRAYGNEWPAEAVEVLQPLGRDLGHLALRRRDHGVSVASWRHVGYLHAPVGCAAELLGVLLAADDGDLAPARWAGRSREPSRRSQPWRPSGRGRPTTSWSTAGRPSRIGHPDDANRGRRALPLPV